MSRSNQSSRVLFGALHVGVACVLACAYPCDAATPTAEDLKALFNQNKEALGPVQLTISHITTVYTDGKESNSNKMSYQLLWNERAYQVRTPLGKSSPIDFAYPTTPLSAATIITDYSKVRIISVFPLESARVKQWNGITSGGLGDIAVGHASLPGLITNIKFPPIYPGVPNVDPTNRSSIDEVYDQITNQNSKCFSVPDQPRHYRIETLIRRAAPSQYSKRLTDLDLVTEINSVIDETHGSLPTRIQWQFAVYQKDRRVLGTSQPTAELIVDGFERVAEGFCPKRMTLTQYITKLPPGKDPIPFDEAIDGNQLPVTHQVGAVDELNVMNIHTLNGDLTKLFEFEPPGNGALVIDRERGTNEVVGVVDNALPVDAHSTDNWPRYRVAISAACALLVVLVLVAWRTLAFQQKR